MAAKNSVPLGYINLPDGAKAIYPMNDIFLNYTFENAEYWEALRESANIFIVRFMQYQPNTSAESIDGVIQGRTQYQHLLGNDNATRDQDLKIIEVVDNSTYVEFQNRAKPDVPVEIRSVQYFGLGIGHSGGKLANQIWLLASDVSAVLHGEMFTRYILQDEVTGNKHPANSGIMYVSLSKLSKEDSVAGELASFLLGKLSEPKYEAARKIADAFKKSFKSFKTDKDVAKMLSLAERYAHDGEVIGIEKGVAIGMEKGVAVGIEKGVAVGKEALADEARELYNQGLDPQEILRMIMRQGSKHSD